MKGSAMGSIVLTPYADALMSLAQSQNLVDEFGDNCAALLELLDESPELTQILANPIVKIADKKEILGKIVGGKVHPFMSNFLSILVDRRRIGYLAGICQRYQAMMRDLRGIVLAEVTSAIALTDAQTQSIRDRVQGMTGSSSVEIATKIDPEIIGGVIIKVGSQVIDSSLRAEIRRLGLSIA
ncbi:ATP synthase F1 subunit delta [Chamaesiphon minutus]|uniref:ATP synthase subunit delta n=1 Tax=Chamaesiphon minutus (strain ATCC 27169 / PCC 6605) TaxID=1173020 RepID=K9UI22_CHAP6|nr:ATP synthase F1 subunit delta [Chamaesiphon minutus]AFY94116.1 ATP synthase, F1 delta subunit [Chamaesiphon minutus PCC 6605]